MNAKAPSARDLIVRYSYRHHSNPYTIIGNSNLHWLDGGASTMREVEGTGVQMRAEKASANGSNYYVVQHVGWRLSRKSERSTCSCI